MNRRLAVLMVAILGLAILIPSSIAVAGDDGRHHDGIRLHGIIAAVGDHGIVLHTRRGNLEIVVTERTRIVRNGERATLRDLARGDHARVGARFAGDRHRLVAIAIVARGRDGGGD